MIKLIKSSFYKEVLIKKNLADFISASSVLSMNRVCFNFEKAFARKQKRKFAVFVNSGSSANLVLIQALLNLGLIKKGDRVGFSALTWATNVMPIIQSGLIPVPLDCELETLNLSSKILAEKIKKVKVLFLTNVLGFCSDINEIRRLCKVNNVIFLEDNCESLGSVFHNELLGDFGLASTFSFFVGHHLSTIEGGMISTDDENLHNMLVMARAHGWDRNLASKYQKNFRKKNKVLDFFARYTFYDLAYNVRPTEINGFLGLQQLRYWDEIVRKRAKSFVKFQQVINRNNDLVPLKTDHMDLVSNFAVPIICKNKKMFVRYMNRFSRADVEIRPIIAGDITLQPFFKKYFRNVEPCKNSRFIHQNGFYFGNSPEYSEEEIQILLNLIKK